MTKSLFATLLAAGLVMTPLQAMSFDTGSLFPTVFYPDPAPEPVTRDTTLPER